MRMDLENVKMFVENNSGFLNNPIDVVFANIIKIYSITLEIEVAGNLNISLKVVVNSSKGKKIRLISSEYRIKMKCKNPLSN